MNFKSKLKNKYNEILKRLNKSLFNKKNKENKKFNKKEKLLKS